MLSLKNYSLLTWNSNFIGHSVFYLIIQSMCQLDFNHLKALPGLMDSFPRWLLNKPSKLALVVCRRNQFLDTWISFWAAWASLCWQLASSIVGDSREGSTIYDLVLKVTHCNFLNLCIDCTGHFYSLWEESYRNTRRQESFGIILEAASILWKLYTDVIGYKFHEGRIFLLFFSSQL